MVYKSDNEIANHKQQLDDLINNSDKIVVFGTGNFGALALHALKKLGKTINCFCDNNRNNWGKKFEGFPVISPDELLMYFSNSHVLIASLHFDYIKKQINLDKPVKSSNCGFLFSDLDLSDFVSRASIQRTRWLLDMYMFSIDRNNVPEYLKIKSLDIVVTEKCSLRCKDCSNLMQYYINPKDCDLEVLIDSIDRFMAGIDELYEARILGGEPFIYKKLHHVINHLVGYNNCKKIIVMTNGTIIPDDNTLESLQNKKISVIISDYGKLSGKVGYLKTKLNNHMIPYFDIKNESWQDAAKIEYRARTKSELSFMFGNCCVSDAITLLHGKLYSCPFAAHSANLKAIDQAAVESVDLKNTDVNSLKKVIRLFCSGKNYLKACSFCAGRDYNVARIEAAVQVDAPLSYKEF
jgi:organic radical activating enzyme